MSAATAGATLLTRALPLALCVGLVAVLRFGGVAPEAPAPQAAPVALGLLLLMAFLGGKAAKAVGLPRITGYLAAGVLAGPYASGLLTKDMVAGIRVVEGIAVALIALAAGGELRIPWVRAQAGRLAGITGAVLAATWLTVVAVVLLARPLFPFVDGPLAHAAAIAAVFGAIAVSCSPMVTLAVLNETRAEGPLARTVLGVVILLDIAVIVLFAAAMAVARTALGGEGAPLAVVLARELLGSVALGLALGAGAIAFLRWVGRDVPAFVLGLCFAIAQLGAALHMEPLLVALAAGFVVENFSPLGHRLIEGIERLALPVFALFFAAAGAKLDLGAVVVAGPAALLVAAARASALVASSRLGGRLTGAEPAVRRSLWAGLVSQAGVSLALAATVARAFPTWGEAVQATVLAMIALHEIVGPVLLQRALVREGEVPPYQDQPPG